MKIHVYGKVNFFSRLEIPLKTASKKTSFVGGLAELACTNQNECTVG